ILRNPYDRLESDLNFDRGKNWDNPIRGFKDPNAFNRSMYFKQLEEYRKVFPSIKLILICFEELKKNPEAAVEKVREQLGLEKIELQFKEEEKHTTAVPTKAQDIAHKFSSIRKLALLLPTPIRKMINNSPFLGKRTKRTLTDTERQYFHELWKDDMQNLKDHYGFNVSQWGF
ncbi:MAG: sulfotransferase domain-containing protein, partial [Verrucomicrobia bacterium]|nr:sulfotransferase domain-containing protein [Verrucomicrobiota bacterium]